MKNIIIIMSCIIFSAATLQAGINVNGAGNFPNIGAALIAAPRGAVLEILDSGTYLNSISINVTNVTIKPAPGQTPTIGWNSAGSAVSIWAPGVTLQNLRIQADGMCPSAVSIGTGITNVSILGCTFVSLSMPENPTAISLQANNNNIKIIGCSISGYAKGINAASGVNNRIYIFYNRIFNSGVGIYLYTGYQNIFIYNNTITKNTNEGIAIFYEQMSPATTEIKNNISFDNRKDMKYDDPKMGNLIVNSFYNCFVTMFQNGLAGYNTGFNTTASPQFNNSLNNDFSLQAGSPCIDAGQDIDYDMLGAVFGVNLSYIPAVVGSHRDMGALEYIKLTDSGPGAQYQFVNLSGNNLSPGKETIITISDLQQINTTSVYIKASIYDIKNKLIKILFDGNVLSSNKPQFSWDGKDKENKYAGSGVYFLRIQLGTIVKTHKIFFTK